jgi:hypothetical protein
VLLKRDKKAEVDDGPSSSPREMETAEEDLDDSWDNGTSSPPKKRESSEDDSEESSCESDKSIRKARKCVARKIRKARKHIKLSWRDGSEDLFEIVNGLSKEIAKEAKYYGRMGDKCLHEAIIAEEKVVELIPECYPARRERLDTLSDLLAKRSRRGNGKMRDLNRAIQITQIWKK